MSTKSSKNKYSPEPVSSRSTYIIGGLAVLVIAALVIGGVLWTNSKNKPPQNDGYGSVQSSEVAVTVQDNGVVLLGKPSAATTIDLFEDPLCPACAALEHLSGQALAAAVDNGDVAVRYHMLNFLNRASGSGDYSTRAGAALLCVAQGGDAIAYSAFHNKLFATDTQPAEGGSSDHTNDDLARSLVMRAHPRTWQPASLPVPTSKPPRPMPQPPARRSRMSGRTGRPR